MVGRAGTEAMMDMFIFETVQLIEQLEQLALDSERKNGLNSYINEIFRIMHTIKGSSAMMLANNISSLAHSLEDVFYYIRENNPDNTNYTKLTDIILETIDFIKSEIGKLENNKNSDGNATDLINVINAFLSDLKGSSQEEINECQDESSKDPETITYRAIIFFENGCEMENIRAFAVVHKLNQIAQNIHHFPVEITDNEDSIEVIRKEGFKINFTCSLPMDEVRDLLEETIFLRELILDIDGNEESTYTPAKKEIMLDEPIDRTEKHQAKAAEMNDHSNTSKQSFISVNVSKMNMLMDLVGELVIAEAMVTQNPDLKGLELENFKKASVQLRKIAGNLQDTIMSMRMVSLSSTFQKMNRIVRDMCKKLNKEVDFEIIGEDTEVDKNIIENLSDPLMHLIRNAIDHGLEPVAERISKGKPEKGKITLEAKNAGGDVWIILKDDGQGLDKDKIFRKAIENGLVQKDTNDLSDKDIYRFIFLPGFSTKDNVTEFSGRGVGMDVVAKDIEKVNGRVLIDSTYGEETVVTIKIPLTLSIIDGMIVKVGNSTYTIPIVSIRESIKIKQEKIIRDDENNEVVMIRGECYPILRLHELFNIKSSVKNIDSGIILIVENESTRVCLFADELIGEQQVVVKALPSYIKKVRGITGCTLLGDGSISLILDIANLINSRQ